MKIFYNFFIPFVVFFLSLEGLSFLWTSSRKSIPLTQEKWIVKEIGDRSRNPDLSDFFSPPLSVIEHEILPPDVPGVRLIYKINEKGIRMSERKTISPEETVFISGCSFVFGIGLNAVDTLSEKLGVLKPEYHFINLGFPSGGVHTALRLPDILNLQSLSSGKKYTYIYVFMPFQIRRWHSDLAYFKYASPGAPRFEMKGKEIVYQGKLRSYYLYRMGQFLNRSYSGRLILNFFMTDRRSESKERLSSFVSGLSKVKEKYLRQFPGGRFVFLRHPLPMNKMFDQDLKRMIESEGIEYADPRQDFMSQAHVDRKDYIVHGDGHPNARMNKFLSTWIVRNILSKRGK